MFLKEALSSTIAYFGKIFSNYLFYLGGGILGAIYYLTGLSVSQLQSILLIIFLDIGTRVWAEIKNKRPVLSKKMGLGFVGKCCSYLILFTLANHAFYFEGIFNYIILGGFSLVEGWSIIENLRDAGQKQITSIIGDRIEKELEKYKDGDSEDNVADTTDSSSESESENNPKI